MNDQITMLRNMIRRQIKEMESFPENEERRAELFENWVKELSTTIAILAKVGDRCFTCIPTFSFSSRLYSDSKKTINDWGYQALKSYLDTLKPLLNVPISVG